MKSEEHYRAIARELVNHPETTLFRELRREADGTLTTLHYVVALEYNERLYPCRRTWRDKISKTKVLNAARAWASGSIRTPNFIDLLIDEATQKKRAPG